MNEAAKLVADSLLGEAFATVILNDKPYTIFPPTIKVICRAAKHFSLLDNKETKIKELLSMPKNSKELLTGIGCLIVGDRPDYLKAVQSLKLNGTMEEILTAMQEALKLISPDPFSKAVILAVNVGGMMAKPLETTQCSDR